MKPWKLTGYPEEAGISSRGISRYLDAAERSGLEHHSVLVWRDGKLACKLNFAPYDDQTPHVLFSLSKSFCSAAAGFAVAEGLLTLDSRVVDVLREDAPERPSEWLERVSLAHLLTMSSGLRPESDEIDHLIPSQEDGAPRSEGGGRNWAKAVLACDCDHAPGTHFHYNSHGSYLISAMVQKVTGQTIRDYLVPRLFEPLGIPKPEWDCCPRGICCGGWGLHLSADSILRFGVCLLQDGCWQGRQILPPGWVERATGSRMANYEEAPVPGNEWAQGYGYQFWRTTESRYRGDGMYGQLCVVSPEDNMAVAVTAGIEDMGAELKLLHDYLFPAAEAEPADEKEKEALQKRIAALRHPWPENDGSGVLPSGRYRCDEMTVETAEEGEGLRVEAKMKNGDRMTFLAGWGNPRESTNPCYTPGAPALRYLSACGWENGTLRLVSRTPEGPFTLHASCRLEGEELSLSVGGAGSPCGEFRLTREA